MLRKPMPALVAALLLGAAAPASAQDGQAALAPPRCDYGAPAPDAPAELAQFDFLIGDYTISAHRWLDASQQWSPPRPGAPPRWNGYYGLDGMAIVDEWFNLDPGVDPATGRGINVRMWDPEAGEWDMMWFDTSARQVQDLRAKEIDGALTMWQVYPGNPTFRAYFERLGPDSWQRVTLAQGEDGEWRKTFLLKATRIPCE